MSRTWLDNAFWETPRKKTLNAISEIVEGNKTTRKVWKLDKLNADGTENEDFKEVVAFLGEEQINNSSKKRLEQKQEEAEVDKQQKLEKERAKKLEKLFAYKLETFEIEEIKASKNRALKSKLRRSKSVPEVNLYAILIIQDSMKNEGTH
jgi:glutamyl/glutaminyl-tRNA synthetase